MLSNLVIPQVLSELRPLALSVPRSSVSFNNLELSPIDYTDRLHCLVAFEMMTSKCHCTIYCSTVHTLHPDSFSTTACPQQPATWSTRSCFSTLTVNAGHTCNDATCPLGVRTCISTKLVVPGTRTPSPYLHLHRVALLQTIDVLLHGEQLTHRTLLAAGC